METSKIAKKGFLTPAPNRHRPSGGRETLVVLRVSNRHRQGALQIAFVTGVARPLRAQLTTPLLAA